MTRQILCWSCGDNFRAAKQDLDQGWELRRVYIVPTGESCKCDTCDVPVFGVPSIAITQWRGRKHPDPETRTDSQPGQWERAYGNIISRETALAAIELAKE